MKKRPPVDPMVQAEADRDAAAVALLEAEYVYKMATKRFEDLKRAKRYAK
jgi:hypothetical protein